MMEMKMTIDWDKPIETVEGHPARVLSTDARYSGDTLAVIQIEHPGHSCVGYYHKNGEPAFGSPEIRNRKTEREGWINIYKDNYTSEIHESKEEAISAARKTVIATIKIEWEE